MKQIRIKLRDTDDVCRFTDIVNSYISDINVYCGSIILDGKSALSLFSLGLPTKVKVQIVSGDNEECDRFKKDMEVFQND